ncbi:MAG: glycosyltransferase family 2 protein [Chloroflexota bacterium]|nr:glycosyltransferase family 2 protein [Chloroflexota bacterium]
MAVVIVSYNVRALLRDCLESLRNSACRYRFRVIVVDNRSKDGSAEMVREEFPEVKLIVSADNGGFAAGNNQGIRAAQGARYVMLLNPDTVVPAQALEGLLDFMESHPEAGVVGPKLVKADGQLDLACRRSFPDPKTAFYHAFWLDRLFPQSREFGRYNLTFLDEDQLAEVDCVVGAAMLVRAEAVERAGLLDEAFFMYGEDLDWAFRISEAGWKVFYNPAVVIVHYTGQSSRQRSVRSTLAFYDAMMIFHRTHYAARTLFAANWAIAAGIGLRCLMALTGNLFHQQTLPWGRRPRLPGAEGPAMPPAEQAP